MSDTTLSKLRQKRVLLGIILDQVYMATGIDQGRLSRLERGLAKATDDEKKILSIFFECNVTDIF